MQKPPGIAPRRLVNEPLHADTIRVLSLVALHGDLLLNERPSQWTTARGPYQLAGVGCNIYNP
jgi:hypothetical protein